MHDEQFNKGIEGLQSIRLTDGEKSRMLKSIFATPIESPYIFSTHSSLALAACLLLVISLGGASYASDESLPGDILYPLKISLVEPVLDVVNRAPEKKIVWEEEKVERRIVEAERLQEKDELDDKRSDELERKIEKSSRAFVKAVEEVNGDNVENRKEQFRQKFGSKSVESFAVSAVSIMSADSSADGTSSKKVENKSKVEKLRRTAVETIDRQDFDDEEDESGG